MSNPDHMQVLRRCARCRSTDDDVCYSNELEMYVCDECYEKIMERNDVE